MGWNSPKSQRCFVIPNSLMVARTLYEKNDSETPKHSANFARTPGLIRHLPWRMSERDVTATPAAGQFGLRQGVLLHEVAEPPHGRKFRMLEDRVLVVGDEQTEDVEIILLIGGERGAVEEDVDDLHGPPMPVIVADWTRRECAKQCEVLGGGGVRLCLDVHGIHSFQSPRSYSAWVRTRRIYTRRLSYANRATSRYRLPRTLKTTRSPTRSAVGKVRRISLKFSKRLLRTRSYHLANASAAL